MVHPLTTLDQHLDRLARAEVLALAACSVLVIGGIDYLSGYEVSISLFYLGPVAVAAWYAGRSASIAIAALSWISWYIADIAAGHQYTHPAIPVWNAVVRFGFFLVTGLLMTMLRTSLRHQQDLARTDALTGLYGRREFENRLKHDLASGQRRKSPLTLAYVDLDNFKALNDIHGHAGGDRVLKLIGGVLKGSVRETDTAARLGGDEFALVLPDTDDHGAQQIISKLTGELHEALEATDWEITCSIGVVTFLGSGTSPQGAVAAADNLMYQVKHKGKGAITFSVLGEAVQHRAAADTPLSANAGPQEIGRKRSTC